MSGLVELARRYVALSDELETIRDGIKRAVLNGARPKENPQSPARKGGLKSSPPAHIVAAAQAEAKILELLREQPGMGTAALARATESRVNTTGERLKRLKARHLITPAEGGGWAASAPA
jgi:hypothetical protein